MHFKKLLITVIVVLSLLASWACQQVAEVSEGSKAVLCSPVTVITTPFTYNGTGEFCWESTSLGTNINSWNLDLLEVNGAAYTNAYVASSAILPVNGKYVIHYKSSVAYGHFEIAGIAVTTGTVVVTATRTSTRTATSRTATATRTVTSKTATATRTITSRTATPTATCVVCEVIVTGNVTNATGQPISGASVYLSTTLKTTTDSLGNYSFTASSLQSIGGALCAIASTSLTVKATGYLDASTGFGQTCGTHVFNFILTAASQTPTPTATASPTGTCAPCSMVVTGKVTDASGNPVANALMYLNSTQCAVTDSSGNYSFTTQALQAVGGGICPVGDSYLSAMKAGYTTVMKFIPMNCGTFVYNFAFPAGTPTPARTATATLFGT